MINKTLSLILLMFVVTTSAAFAAGDPMKSLFMFQKQMADKGNASAMMKMGVMYERGEGVEKSYANALKMYQQANQAGHPKAKVEVQRLKNIKNKSENKKKLAAQKRQRALDAQKLKKQREAAANKRAQEAAKNKELRDKLNKEKAAKAKAAKAKAEKNAKAKAAKNAKAKAAKDAKAKAARDAKAKAKAARDAKAKAKAARDAKAKAKIKAAKLAAEKKKQQSKNPKEGFKSDPCKGKAARLLSICR